MAYLKPQSPLKDKKSGDYFYPLTTADQVVMPDGSRLNSVFKHTVRTNITLLASAWSSTAPYKQTIALNDYIDNLKVGANIVYIGVEEADLKLNKAASCLSYIKKNGKNITFYCLNSKPEIDVPVEISYESVNSIATVGTSEEIDLDDELAAQAELISELQEALQGKMGKGVLDFSIVGGTNQPVDPEKNMIWVQTADEENVVIASWAFGAEEPANLVDGMIWIVTGTSSNVKFDAIKDNDIELYPMFAKQYIGGAWVNKTAKSWQGGVWVEWIPYIIQSGVISNKFELVTIRTANPFAVEQHDDYLRMYDTVGGSNGYGTSKGVDVTDISKIILVCKIINPGDVSNGGCGVGLAKTVNANLDYEASIANIVASEMRTVAGSYTLELNVESYSGVYYPCIWARSIQSSKADIYVYDFYYV